MKTPSLSRTGTVASLGQYLANGYTINSDGPSGIALTGPRVMKTQTKWAIGISLPLILVAGVGLILLLFALIDYGMTKGETVFLTR